MTYKSDIEIAGAATLEGIEAIAKRAGIGEEYIERYGRYKAKITPDFYNGKKNTPDGKLILVTAITPTPAGEGKTTTSVGLADGMKRIGKNVIAALREPSQGPVFGIKGGAAGGGYAQVVPMEDINLHFTGDIHAVTAANNLLAAMIDNHIFQGNTLDIDPENIIWRRCLDINDRQLRSVENGLGGKFDGVPRKDGFDISVASEIMAVLCLADDLDDLKTRIRRIVIGYNRSGNPVTAEQLGAAGALAVLLKDAIRPNLVQTLEGTPAILHGGPFANIAHGCNSVIATKTALKAADYVVTEAGFGADLGAEKFFDIKCREANLRPSAVVVVATVRALKMHGGAEKDSLGMENLTALKAGLPNLMQHVDNIKNVFQLPVVVAVNRFPTDADAEIALVQKTCGDGGIKAVLSDVWAKGGDGAIDLANEVVRICEMPNQFTFCYNTEDTIEEKINSIARRVYRADGAEFSEMARKQMEKLQKDGFSGLPVCIAKTQYSFSDNAKLLGTPRDFHITVRGLKLSAGAGFIVALSGKIMTMPGLPKEPAAIHIDIDNEGNIKGLF